VDGLPQGILNIVMTGIALLGFEEIFNAFVNMVWIRVDVTTQNVLMAIQTGCLTVGRHVKGSPFDQPRGLRLVPADDQVGW
jgi:hypothetical protein